MGAVNRTMTILLLGAGIIFSTGSSAPAQEQESEKFSFPEQRLAAGDSVPEMSFTDICGKSLTNADYRDWVIVYSFADRKSNKELQERIAPAGVEAARKYPEAKMVYISIADVAGVPGVFRPIVNPILKAINDKHTKTMEEFYRERGVELDPDKSGFSMVPDWEGIHLKTFGLENAKKYHCFVTFKSKVVAVFDSAHPPVTDEYVRVFDEIMSPQPQ